MRTIPAGAGPTRLAVRLADDANEATAWVAAELIATIRATAAAGRPCVLVLPTGSTPRAVYARLVAEHRAGRLSFAHVTTFNLDEYHGLAGDDQRSYRAFMRRELFDHVDLDPARAHVPRGDLPAEEVAAHAAAYEQAIAAAGGADLALLGIGRNGHIAFNEPGSGADSRTRLVALDRVTRHDAAASFGGEAAVPRRAVTMGVGAIRAARRVLLLAVGGAKATALAAAVEGPATAACPASWLQDHLAATVVTEPAAAAQLAALRRPWLAGPLAWTPTLALQAVTDLAQRAGKPLLTLTEDDYAEHGLQDLAAEQGGRGGVEGVNRDAFRHLQAVTTGWPGGKPAAHRRPGDIPRPGDERFPKRVLVLSPHPDDDVISMGGTLARLVEQGHEVHVAYQVSGHRAVHDDDLARHLEFVRGAAGDAAAAIAAARPASELKALVRRTEAVAAAAVCGVPAARLRFLDLPLYATRAVGEADIAAHVALLAELAPDQVYAAGDLLDPNGTHRLCLDAFLAAWRSARPAHCRGWLYRGAWADWEAHEVAMAVPLSPSDVERKRQAILRHQSQKDRALFPGDDPREFWQRAAERNRAAAATWDGLGLPAYAALELFAAIDA